MPPRMAVGLALCCAGRGSTLRTCPHGGGNVSGERSTPSCPRSAAPKCRSVRWSWRTASCWPPMPVRPSASKMPSRSSRFKKGSCIVGQSDSEDPDRRGERMSAALELGQRVGQGVACRALGVPRASLYRSLQPAAPHRARPTPARALDALERQAVFGHLHAERFYDKAPSEVYRSEENTSELRSRHYLVCR